MKHFLERSFPPGYAYKPELKALTAALAWSILSSFVSFLVSFSSARQSLYIRLGNKLLLDETRVMPDFVNILNNYLIVYFIFAALILAAATIIHYAYYHRESKSIYLMRRLPNRFELHRRSLLIPLLSALIHMFVAFVMLLILYAVYMIFTPKACLAPDQWNRMWSVFLLSYLF